MDGLFIDLANTARAAVMAKDAAGYCVYANRREEALRGAAPGDLINKHITELVDADPLLVEREFDRFKRDGAWVGRYRIHDAAGQPLWLRSCNFVHREWDGNPLYVSFAYPAKARATLDSSPAQVVQPSMSTADVCIAQLCADGYTDYEISRLQGISREEVGHLVARFIESVGARSRTEACVIAFKSRLAT